MHHLRPEHGVELSLGTKILVESMVDEAHSHIPIDFHETEATVKETGLVGEILCVELSLSKLSGKRMKQLDNCEWSRSAMKPQENSNRWNPVIRRLCDDQFNRAVIGLVECWW